MTDVANLHEELGTTIYYTCNGEPDVFLLSVLRRFEQRGRKVVSLPDGIVPDPFKDATTAAPEKLLELMMRPRHVGDAHLIFLAGVPDEDFMRLCANRFHWSAFASNKWPVLIPVIYKERFLPLPDFVRGHSRLIDVARFQPEEAIEQIVQTTELTIIHERDDDRVRREMDAQALSRVQYNATEYVTKTIEQLSESCRRNRTGGLISYGFAILATLATVWFVSTTVHDLLSKPVPVESQWLYSLRSILLTALAITFLVPVAKFCGKIGSTYVRESLRDNDRKHAISFGHFCLRAIAGGARAELGWRDLREMFQHWNIDYRRSSPAEGTDGEEVPTVLQALERLVTAAMKRGATPQ
jgi:hypothetical protein